MENALDIYALGIQSAAETARQIMRAWINEAGGMINRKVVKGRIACMNEQLKNELLKLI